MSGQDAEKGGKKCKELNKNVKVLPIMIYFNSKWFAVYWALPLWDITAGKPSRLQTSHNICLQHEC